MDTLFGLLSVAAVLYCFYRGGKRAGSRKGFQVGLARGRRRHRR